MQAIVYCMESNARIPSGCLASKIRMKRTNNDVLFNDLPKETSFYLFIHNSSLNGKMKGIVWKNKPLQT